MGFAFLAAGPAADGGDSDTVAVGGVGEGLAGSPGSR